MSTTKNSNKPSEELMAHLTSLINKGRRNGELTSDEVLTALEKMDLSVEKIEQVYDTFGGKPGAKARPRGVVDAHTVENL